MPAKSTQLQPEKVLRFSSFNQKDDGTLQEIISRLRKAGTSVAVSAESQAISEHYIREIGSNFLEKGKMMGEIKRGPTDRSGIISSINRALVKSQQQKKESSPEHRELWIFYANASDDLTAVQLAENLVRQFRDCNISIAIVCSSIVVRSSNFQSWSKKTRVPLFDFERPSRQDMDDYLLRAEASGSVHLARSLLKTISEGRATPLQDADLIDIAEIRQEITPKHKPAKIVPDRSNKPRQKKGKVIQRHQVRGHNKLLKIGSYFGGFLIILLCPALLAAVLFDSEDWTALKAIVFEVDASSDSSLASTKSEQEKQTSVTEKSEPQLTDKPTTKSFGVQSGEMSKSKGKVDRNAISRIHEEATVKTENSLTPSPIIQAENVVVTTQETNAAIESSLQKLPIPPRSDENLKYLQYGAFALESSARRLLRLEHYEQSQFFVAQKKNGLWAVLSGPYNDNLARELIENSTSSDSFFMVQEEDVQTNSNPRRLGNG